MKLWIVDTRAGTRWVTYAPDRVAARASVRDRDRDLASDVGEWPSDATFAVAFEPTTVPTGDAQIFLEFWDGVPDGSTHDALGAIREAAERRDGFDLELKDEHERGEHEHAPPVHQRCARCPQRPILNGAFVSVNKKEVPPRASTPTGYTTKDYSYSWTPDWDEEADEQDAEAWRPLAMKFPEMPFRITNPETALEADSGRDGWRHALTSSIAASPSAQGGAEDGSDDDLPL